MASKQEDEVIEANCVITRARTSPPDDSVYGDAGGDGDDADADQEELGSCDVGSMLRILKGKILKQRFAN